MVQIFASIHSLRFIHRDIKLDNLFLTRRSGKLEVKVGDFGTARKLDPNGKRMHAFHGN